MSKLLKVYRNFSGGLSEVANDNMKDNELVMAQNAEPSSTYGIQRCSGTREYQKMTNFDGPVEYIIPFTARTATENNGETVYVYTDQMVAFTEILPGELYGGYCVSGETTWHTIDVAITFPAIKGWFVRAYVLYFLTGEHIYSWDGTTLTQMTKANADALSGQTIDQDVWDRIETASAVIKWLNRWFYAVDRDELWFSEDGSPFYVQGTSEITIGMGNKDVLTALHEFNGDILIFKKHGVYRLTGTYINTSAPASTDMKVSQLNLASGCNYPDTIATIDNAVLFLAGGGLCKLSVPYYSSTIAGEIISLDKINKKLMKDKGAPVDAKGVAWDSIYYISLTFADGSVEEYRYHIKEKSFWGPYTSGARCYAPFVFDDDRLYIGLGNGYIAYYDDTQSSFFDPDLQQQSAIPMIVKTKAFDVVGVMFQNAKVKKAFIAAKQYADQSSGLYIQIKADYADEAKTVDQESYEHMIGDALNTKGISFDESLVWQEGEWWEERWGWNDTVCKQLPIGRKTKHFQFILKSNEANPLVIYGLGLQYKRKKVKGDTKGVNDVEVLD